MCLARYGAKKLDPNGWEYELTFHYQDDDDLNRQVYDYVYEMEGIADLRNRFTESDFLEVGTERSC
ncbi:MAG: hypothetical protein DHS20C09_21770 [marine bacterium B5-7]|nr:MAG: hypothetical protein DHS20C09_21770 [marine bacterium B5-7]